MKDFPEFMKNEKNHISSSQQDMKDIDGYHFKGRDGSQIVLGKFYPDRISKLHKHEFDEYVVCVCGQYIVIMNGKEVILNVGNELFIPKGAVHGGIFIPGARTIHSFGGKRIKNDKS